MGFTGGAHQVIASDPGAVTFPSATNCTVDTSFSGNPFGTAATGAGAGSIVFQTDSVYTHNGGDSPFGAATDPQIVNFVSGSAARWYTTSGFQASGRTYASLVIGEGAAGAAVQSR